MLNAKLSDPRNNNKVIYFYSGSHGHRRTNAVYLICSWLVLQHDVSPDDAFRPFKSYSPAFIPWHDATPCHCPFPLSIMDTLRGLDKARKFNYFNFHSFDINEYEHFEQVENGDLNWCWDGKFLAFAGPHQSTEVRPLSDCIYEWLYLWLMRMEMELWRVLWVLTIFLTCCAPLQVPMEGYHALPPDHYIPYFKRRNVTLVIRFNKKCYDAKSFKNAGIDHAGLSVCIETSSSLTCRRRPVFRGRHQPAWAHSGAVSTAMWGNTG